jgi:starch phosphorylase
MDTIQTDFRLGNDPKELQQAILDNLYYVQGKSTRLATKNDWYMAVAYTVRDRMMKHWINSLHKLAVKRSRSSVIFLQNSLLAASRQCHAKPGMQENMSKAMVNLGLDPQEVIHQEEEPGSG